MQCCTNSWTIIKRSWSTRLCNDVSVMAGQGTVMVKLADQAADLDIVLAPVCGRGIPSGLCLSAHKLRPCIAIFACEPTSALDRMDGVKQNRIDPMPSPNTLANGLRTSLRELPLSIVRRHVTGFFVVGEEEIVQAIQFAHEQFKLVIESSSAVALALLLRQEPQLVSKRVGAVFTGGYVGGAALATSGRNRNYAAIGCLSSNSKYNTAGPERLRCCHANERLYAPEYQRT